MAADPPPSGDARLRSAEQALLDSEARRRRAEEALEASEARFRALEERHKLLVAELQHRVRNVLAIVSSVVSRTDGEDQDVDEYRAHLSGRLASMARTQALLSQRAGAGLDLESLVREELLAQTADDAQVRVAGPDVQLAPKAAEVVTLAVHELATNSTKYGALSTPDGAVDISWSVETDSGERWLRLDWRETGVRVLTQAPRREGFGSQLITQRVPYELRGRGSIQFRPGGVHASIAFPMRPGESILQTDLRPPEPDSAERA